MKDKTKKIKRGLVEIKKSSEMRVGEGKKAVMVVDADDRVNHNLTRWVKNNQYGHGWYIKSGVVYPYGRSFVFTSYVLGNAFYKSCGTSYIAYCNEYNLPSDIKDDSIIPVPHHTIVSSMKKKGKPLKRLPFKGACDVTDTGDNHSGISFLRWRGRKDFLRQLLSIRPLVFYRKKFAIRKDS